MREALLLLPLALVLTGIAILGGAPPSLAIPVIVFVFVVGPAVYAWLRRPRGEE